MNKPNNYENTQAYSGYEPLNPGGYVCTILKVEETTSSTHKPMLKIYLDIAEGDDKGYYAAQFKGDSRQDKKWGCIVNQLTEDEDHNCNKGLKTFITSVAASNPGFNPDAIWGDNFAKYFSKRLVGGLFRREEYVNRNGENRWSTKCFSFKPADVIREGVDVPEDKHLKDTKKAPTYRDLDDSDGELPF